MSAYNVLGCKSHDGGGGGGDCCECSLTLELDAPRTYTGPGSMGGQSSDTKDRVSILYPNS